MLQPKAAGDVVRASEWNELVGLVLALGREVGRLKAIEGRLGELDRILPARVVAVNGSGSPAGSLTYDVQPIGRGDVAIIPALSPWIGRPADDDTDVTPAAVGDPCIVVRFPDGEDGTGGRFETRLILGEKLVFTDCG